MPYLKEEEKRKIFKDGLINLDHVQTKGQLNYTITILCKHYWDRFGPDYETIDQIVWALETAKQIKTQAITNKDLISKNYIDTAYLDESGELYDCIQYACEYFVYNIKNPYIGYYSTIECAKQEFIHRVVRPHEDKKIKQNGDVYKESL